jgi:hypothetical protein
MSKLDALHLRFKAELEANGPKSRDILANIAETPRQALKLGRKSQSTADQDWSSIRPPREHG